MSSYTPSDIPGNYSASIEDLLLEILNKIEEALPTLAGHSGMAEVGGATASDAATALTAGKCAIWINPVNAQQAALIFKTAAGKTFYLNLTNIT